MKRVTRFDFSAAYQQQHKLLPESVPRDAGKASRLETRSTTFSSRTVAVAKW